MLRPGYYYVLIHYWFVSELMSKIMWIMLSGNMDLWRELWALEKENTIPFQMRKQSLKWFFLIKQNLMQICPANPIEGLLIFNFRNPSNGPRGFWSDIIWRFSYPLSLTNTTGDHYVSCALLCCLRYCARKKKKLRSLWH